MPFGIKKTRPPIDLKEITTRLRGSNDAHEILRAAIAQIHTALGADRTSVWLTESEAPQLGAFAGPDPREAPVSGVVNLSITTKTVLRDGNLLSVPMLAPRTGALGALVVERAGIDEATEDLLTQIAGEVAYALETVNLYDQAVSGKDKYEAVLARVGEAVVITDYHGTVMQWNPSAEQTFGMKASDAIGGHCGLTLRLSSDDRAIFDCRDCPLLASGELEVMRTGADGVARPLLATAAAVLDREGSVSEIVHSFRDITRLKQADEAKSMFLATTSHELKTPLTVIQGYAQLLNRPMNDVDRTRALEAIDRRAKELSEIVDRLLLSSTIEAGRAVLHLAPVEVAPIVKLESDKVTRATDRTIVSKIDDAAPMVAADRGALTTVLMHLLDNAVKFSPDGEQVVVSLRAEGTGIALSVTDEGIGMDAEQIAHCYEKFWQANASDARRFGGTGIGLYIVRSLVDAMAGTIKIESTPGKGSTFTVRLGVGDSEAAVAPDPLKLPQPSVIREFMRQIGVPARR